MDSRQAAERSRDEAAFGVEQHAVDDATPRPRVEPPPDAGRAATGRGALGGRRIECGADGEDRSRGSPRSGRGRGVKESEATGRARRITG